MSTVIAHHSVAQPDAYSCQSACIANVLGVHDVHEIYAELAAIGTPGDPAVMGQYLQHRVQSYQFLATGSLLDAKDALDEGFSIITHGWFTGSGHVICLFGYATDQATMSYRFMVDDPWAEFSFPEAQFTAKSGSDVRYSSYGLYAYCVASHSHDHAAQIYADRVLLSSEKGAWLHIIKH